MKKFILFFFLGFILIFGFFVMTTKNKVNYTTTTTITTTTTLLDHVEITNQIIKEDIGNYIIDVSYPVTHITKLDESIYSIIEKQINEFKDAVKIPSPNSAKTTFVIKYIVVSNQDNLISIKFETESYTGGAHPTHLIWTKNFDIKDKKEIIYEDIFINEIVLNNIAKYSKEYFKNKKLEYKLFEEGFEPKKENYQVFAITDDSLIIYFNEYQIAPYAAGNFQIKIPPEIITSENIDNLEQYFDIQS